MKYIRKLFSTKSLESKPKTQTDEVKDEDVEKTPILDMRLPSWVELFGNKTKYPFLGRTIVSGFINVINNEIDSSEIIFTIKSYLPTKYLHKFNLETEKIGSIKFPFPSELNKYFNCNLIINCIPNYNNKLIIMGQSYQPKALYFFFVVNLKTMSILPIIDPIENNNYCNIHKTSISGTYNSMHGEYCKVLFIYDWLFVSENDTFFIYYFDNNRNYPMPIFEENLYKYCKFKYKKHGMILLNNINNIKKNGYIKILLFGGMNINFSSSFCLIKIEYKSLEDLTLIAKNSIGKLNNFDVDVFKLKFEVIYDINHDLIKMSITTSYKVLDMNDNLINILFKNCEYYDFSYNLIDNRYLLITGGVHNADQMIYYDLIINKWFKCLNKLPIYIPLSCHSIFIWNNNLYIFGNNDKKTGYKSCFKIKLHETGIFTWDQERILWIGWIFKWHKQYKMSKHVLRYIFTFL